MSENTTHRVNYALAKITTESIDLYPESFEEGKPAKITAALNFGASRNGRLVKVMSKNTFLQDDLDFMEIEVSCLFVLDEESWDLFCETRPDSFVLPRGLAGHLAGLTISTARGILHNETENTPLNNYFIPVNNAGDMIPEDVVLPLE